MKGMRQDLRVYSPPDAANGQNALTQGFIAVSEDQIVGAFRQLKESAEQMSLQMIAQSIGAETRSLDVLEAISKSQNKDKICALLATRIRSIRHALKQYENYRARLKEIGTGNDRAISYEAFGEPLGKSAAAVKSYFDVLYPELAGLYGVTFTGHTKRAYTKRLKNTSSDDSTLKKEVLSGTENEKFEQLENIVRARFAERPSIATGIRVRDISKNLYIMRDGTSTSVNEQYVRTLFLQMRRSNITLYTELAKYISDL